MEAFVVHRSPRSPADSEIISRAATKAVHAAAKWTEKENVTRRRGTRGERRRIGSHKGAGALRPFRALMIGVEGKQNGVSADAGYPANVVGIVAGQLRGMVELKA